MTLKGRLSGVMRYMNCMMKATMRYIVTAHV